MYVALEIFNIPEKGMDELRAEIGRLQRTHFGNDDLDQLGITSSFREGICPYTGERYLSVLLYGFDEIDLRLLAAFQRDLESVHPRADEPVVQGNLDIRMEEDWPDITDYEDDPALSGRDDIVCWVCGRGDGDTWYPPGQEQAEMLTIDFPEEIGVPLCTVCRRLFIARNA